MRLFVAVNFEETVRASIARALETFPVARPPWRWVAPEAWHVTLKFLGETPEADVDSIARALEPACARHAPFRLVLGTLGAFPNRRRPRVLFYEAAEGADALERLADDVAASLEAALGLPPERRAFQAHATVARVKAPIPADVASHLEAAPALSGAAQEVSEVALMRSRLSPQGARYQCVKAFALRGGK
ncbi:MAG: RNA 2',3'-cyclic phosphodiesterase [Candidatus Krumholzibacteria bacterium]|nr:RNA 2',3'-cyclic phosphodiesterase [Candidatus Krumholzibacteria bacterium]